GFIMNRTPAFGSVRVSIRSSTDIDAVGSDSIMRVWVGGLTQGLISSLTLRQFGATCPPLAPEIENDAAKPSDRPHDPCIASRSRRHPCEKRYDGAGADDGSTP